MPELPDLEVFSQNLTRKLKGKKLSAFTLYKHKKVNASAEAFKTALEKQQLEEVRREGKELRFVFSNKQVLGLHLMLKGQLQLFEGTSEIKSKIIELLFDDNTGLVMSDFMGAATPSLNPVEVSVPDALSDEVNYSFLKKSFTDAKEPVKSFLLDQKKIRGIGNAYADEILYDAAISPFSHCNKIPETNIKQLAKSIRSVLKDAEKQILKANPDQITGELRDFLKVHTSKKTHTETGALIHNKMLNSRKTYYTDEQELFE